MENDCCSCKNRRWGHKFRKGSMWRLHLGTRRGKTQPHWGLNLGLSVSRNWENEVYCVRHQSVVAHAEICTEKCRGPVWLRRLWISYGWTLAFQATGQNSSLETQGNTPMLALVVSTALCWREGIESGRVGNFDGGFSYCLTKSLTPRLAPPTLPLGVPAFFVCVSKIQQVLVCQCWHIEYQHLIKENTQL